MNDEEERKRWSDAHVAVMSSCGGGEMGEEFDCFDYSEKRV